MPKSIQGFILGILLGLAPLIYVGHVLGEDYLVARTSEPTEIAITVEGKQFVTLSAWFGPQSFDHTGKFGTALTYATDWRIIARSSVRRNVAITTMQCDENSSVLGTYTNTSHTIRICERVLSEPIDVQASLLAHEIFHSSQFAPADCVENEMQAYRWQAYTYDLVMRPDGDTDLTGFLDELTRRWQAGEDALRPFVLDNLGVSKQCGS